MTSIPPDNTSGAAPVCKGPTGYEAAQIAEHSEFRRLVNDSVGRSQGYVLAGAGAGLYYGHTLFLDFLHQSGCHHSELLCFVKAALLMSTLSLIACIWCAFQAGRVQAAYWHNLQRQHSGEPHVTQDTKTTIANELNDLYDKMSKFYSGGRWCLYLGLFIVVIVASIFLFAQ